MDKIADSSLNDAKKDLDFSTIKRCKYLTRQSSTGRYFAAGDSLYPSRLYWSEPDSPGQWLSDSYYEPLTGGGPVKGLANFSDGIMVMYATCFYAYRGTNPGSTTDAEDTGNVTWSRLPIDHGIVNGRATALTPGTFTFLSLGGIWTLSDLVYSSINVSIVETSSLVKNLAQNKVLTEINAITERSLCRMVWDIPRQRLLLAYTTETDAECCDKILVYHWGIGGGFTRYIGLKVYDFCLLDTGELLFSSGDRIYRMYSGTSDDGSPIETKVETPFYDMNAPMVRKKLSKLFIKTEGGNSASTIQIQVSNGSKVVAVKQISLYSYGLWNGDYSWDDSLQWPEIGVLNKERMIQGIMEGSQFQINLYNLSAERIKIFALGLEYKQYTVKGDSHK